MKGSFHLEEFFKDGVEMLRRDSNPAISHRDGDLMASPPLSFFKKRFCRYGNLTALRSEFNGVIDQINQNLLYFFFVNIDRRKIIWVFDFD